MKICVITLFPEMFRALEQGIVGRAIKNKILNLECINPRNFTTDSHRTVDDRPYGGGPGMILKFEPLHAAIQSTKLKLPNSKVILLSPQGRQLTQEQVEDFSTQNELILVAGRYEGVDERLILQDIDEECSIGDYVVSGGELPAMVMIDAITRLLPEALGHHESAQQDSFSHGLLDHPHYTRPEKIGSMEVPEVLQNGNHAKIERWRLKQALGKTWQKRPDLLKRRILNEKEQLLLEEFIQEFKES